MCLLSVCSIKGKIPYQTVFARFDVLMMKPVLCVASLISLSALEMCLRSYLILMPRNEFH